MFYNLYLGGGLMISISLLDVHFLRTKRAVLREQKQTKAFQMVDPHFRLCVSVHEINKIKHGRLEILNLPSHVE